MRHLCYFISLYINNSLKIPSISPNNIGTIKEFDIIDRINLGTELENRFDFKFDDYEFEFEVDLKYQMSPKSYLDFIYRYTEETKHSIGIGMTLENKGKAILNQRKRKKQ